MAGLAPASVAHPGDRRFHLKLLQTLAKLHLAAATAGLLAPQIASTLTPWIFPFLLALSPIIGSFLASGAGCDRSEISSPPSKSAFERLDKPNFFDPQSAQDTHSRLQLPQSFDRQDHDGSQ
jgi:hypothetical protein